MVLPDPGNLPIPHTILKWVKGTSRRTFLSKKHLWVDRCDFWSAIVVRFRKSFIGECTHWLAMMGTRIITVASRMHVVKSARRRSACVSAIDSTKLAFSLPVYEQLTNSLKIVYTQRARAFVALLCHTRTHSFENAHLRQCFDILVLWPSAPPLNVHYNVCYLIVLIGDCKLLICYCSNTSDNLCMFMVTFIEISFLICRTFSRRLGVYYRFN